MKLQICGLLFAAFSSFLAISAQAALGDQLVTSSSTSNSLKAMSAGSSYSVVEVTDANDVKIRQYVDQRGNVFAISWFGRTLPQIRTLLGSYTPEYQVAIKSRAKVHGRRSVNISTQNIVVEGSSRQGSQIGRAYIPANLPNGFDLKDINFDE